MGPGSLKIPVGFKEERVLRGQVADFPKKSVSVQNPKSKDWETKEYDFISGAVLLDLKGGALMPQPGKGRSKLSEPGEGLFIDSEGRLVSRRELLDSEQFHSLTETKTADEGEENDRNGLPGTGKPGDKKDDGDKSPFQQLMPGGGAKKPKN